LKVIASHTLHLKAAGLPTWEFVAMHLHFHLAGWPR
jgi:hypothetical protein